MRYINLLLTLTLKYYTVASATMPLADCSESLTSTLESSLR